MANSLADVFSSGVSSTLNLPDGRTVKIGFFSVDIMCCVEEEFGGMEKLQGILSNPMANLISFFDFVFMLVENKEDFTDIKDFRMAFPVQMILDINYKAKDSIKKSMPKKSSKKVGKKTRKKKIGVR